MEFAFRCRRVVKINKNVFGQQSINLCYRSTDGLSIYFGRLNKCDYKTALTEFFICKGFLFGDNYEKNL